MLLSDEQQMIQDMARRFAAAKVAPFAADWERSGEGAPVRVYREMAAAGLMGICVPPDWGGAGADFVSYVLATEELAAADCGVCNVMNANNSPVCAAILDHGTEDQKRRFLGPLVGGEMHGAVLLTEPHAGSDAAAIRTRATRRGAGYVLDGTKQFITAGASAGLAMIAAVTDPAAGKRGISTFLVPTGTPGYQVARLEDKLGHRNCDTAQIALEGVEVPAESLLGREGEGLGITLRYLAAGRIAVGAQAVGVARAAYEAALAYAGQRETFGTLILRHQAIGFMLAEMATEIEAARQIVLHAAQLKDAGRSTLLEASMAKLFASEMAERVCSKAIQIHGGYGYVRDYPVEKYWRDARVLQIYEGTSEVQKLVISRALAPA